MHPEPYRVTALTPHARPRGRPTMWPSRRSRRLVPQVGQRGAVRAAKSSMGPLFILRGPHAPSGVPWWAVASVAFHRAVATAPGTKSPSTGSGPPRRRGGRCLPHGDLRPGPPGPPLRGRRWARRTSRRPAMAQGGQFGTTRVNLGADAARTTTVVRTVARTGGVARRLACLIAIGSIGPSPGLAAHASSTRHNSPEGSARDSDRWTIKGSRRSSVTHAERRTYRWRRAAPSAAGSVSTSLARHRRSLRLEIRSRSPCSPVSPCLASSLSSFWDRWPCPGGYLRQALAVPRRRPSRQPRQGRQRVRYRPHRCSPASIPLASAHRPRRSGRPPAPNSRHQDRPRAPRPSPRQERHLGRRPSQHPTWQAL
jgi:hypothetical protein